MMSPTTCPRSCSHDLVGYRHGRRTHLNGDTLAHRLRGVAREQPAPAGHSQPTPKHGDCRAKACTCINFLRVATPARHERASNNHWLFLCSQSIRGRRRRRPFLWLDAPRLACDGGSTAGPIRGSRWHRVPVGRRQQSVGPLVIAEPPYCSRSGARVSSLPALRGVCLY